MKASIWKFIKEMIPVMLGVYLGFALNNYGEERKELKQTEGFRTMLVNEIQHNKKSIANGVDYHQKLGNRFDEILESDDLKKSFSTFTSSGLRPGFVSRSAYDTGIQTGLVQNFDLQLVQSLNRLYALQAKYDNFNNEVLSSVLSRKYPETTSEIKSMLINMSMNMNDINSYEEELLSFYDGILNEMGED